MLAASVAESNALVLCLSLSRESLIYSPGGITTMAIILSLLSRTYILVNDKNGAKVWRIAQLLARWYKDMQLYTASKCVDTMYTVG